MNVALAVLCLGLIAATYVFLPASFVTLASLLGLVALVLLARGLLRR
ncbi:MAG: hypothetical protein AAGF90_18130 [Pseudomonadota bacterium]